MGNGLYLSLITVLHLEIPFTLGNSVARVSSVLSTAERRRQGGRLHFQLIQTDVDMLQFSHAASPKSWVLFADPQRTWGTQQPHPPALCWGRRTDKDKELSRSQIWAISIYHWASECGHISNGHIKKSVGLENSRVLCCPTSTPWVLTCFHSSGNWNACVVRAIAEGPRDLFQGIQGVKTILTPRHAVPFPLSFSLELSGGCVVCVTLQWTVATAERTQLSTIKRDVKEICKTVKQIETLMQTC